MLASIPASTLNQSLRDLEIPNRFTLKSSRFRTAKSKLTKQPKPRRQVRGRRQPGHWLLQDAKAL